MKVFLVHTVASNKERGHYLFTEEQVEWKVRGYLSSCGWLNGTGWEEFLEKAPVGKAFVFDGMISVVRLADFDETDLD